MPAPQGRYFLLTIPFHHFTPYLPNGISYIKGQLEVGAGTGYQHWQLICVYPKKVTCTAVKNLFGQECHVELSRSEAANNYVWKDETAVEGTRFELGKLATKRNCSDDWEDIWKAAKERRIEDIPADIRIRHYNAISRISKDYMQPNAQEKEVWVFWGPTGTGKSRRAWEEATLEAYPKIPSSKFWDGYRGQENVVIDEFTGEIGITHMLRWLDRYPVTVENKGGGIPLEAKKIWITSNINPTEWYMNVPRVQVDALLRRMNIVHMGI